MHCASTIKKHTEKDVNFRNKIPINKILNSHSNSVTSQSKNRIILKTFKELGISDQFIKALNEINIVEPSEIQIKSIPFLLKNKTDFIGQAQTGTGKTAAFGLPLLEKVDGNDNNIQALILAPTRELCQQIAKQLFKFTKYSEKIFIEAVYGGEKIDIQMRN